MTSLLLTNYGGQEHPTYRVVLNLLYSESHLPIKQGLRPGRARFPNDLDLDCYYCERRRWVLGYKSLLPCFVKNVMILFNLSCRAEVYIVPKQ